MAKSHLEDITSTTTTHHSSVIIIIIKTKHEKKSDYLLKPAAVFSVSSFLSLKHVSV